MSKYKSGKEMICIFGVLNLNFITQQCDGPFKGDPNLLSALFLFLLGFTNLSRLFKVQTQHAWVIGVRCISFSLPGFEDNAKYLSN